MQAPLFDGLSFDSCTLFAGLGPTELGFGRGVQQIPANRTRRIVCKKELWVPSARIGGCTPVGSSWVGFLKGVGGVLIWCEAVGD